jgi:hypothetical protein
VKAPELESAVWAPIRALLEDPARLFDQFEAFSRAALEGDAQDQAEQHHVSRRLDRLTREERRLLDAYQAEVITLDELSERRVHLEQRRRALIVQQEQTERLRRERFRAQEVLASLTAFCERIRARLDQPTFEERQVLLNLVVERIIVGEDTLEIRHVIPLGHSPPTTGTACDEQIRRLSPDGVRPTALPAGALEHGRDRRLQSLMRIAGDELDAPETTRHQTAQERMPERTILARSDVEPEHFALPVLIDADGDNNRHADDTVLLPDFDKVGSERSAVLASQPTRFLAPSAEPDVRLATHPALHVFMPMRCVNRSPLSPPRVRRCDSLDGGTG